MFKQYLESIYDIPSTLQVVAVEAIAAKATIIDLVFEIILHRNLTHWHTFKNGFYNVYPHTLIIIFCAFRCHFRFAHSCLKIYFNSVQCIPVIINLTYRIRYRNIIIRELSFTYIVPWIESSNFFKKVMNTNIVCRLTIVNCVLQNTSMLQ